MPLVSIIRYELPRTEFNSSSILYRVNYSDGECRYFWKEVDKWFFCLMETSTEEKKVEDVSLTNILPAITGVVDSVDTPEDQYKLSDLFHETPDTKN